MQASLSAVTTLKITLMNTSGSFFAAAPDPYDLAALNAALGKLVGACPALESLKFWGDMPLSLLHRAAAACPRLCALKLSSIDHELVCVQSILNQLQSLLPGVNSLCLELLTDDLPNMSGNTGILSLHLDDQALGSDTCWDLLPPNLQDLRCHEMWAGPDVNSDSRLQLGSLLCLRIDVGSISLPVLVKLLQATPALQRFKQERGFTDAVIDISLNSSTAADLKVVMQKMHVFRDPVLKFNCESDNITGSQEVFFSALPCMTGIKYCKLSNIVYHQLPHLMAMFPDVEVLSLKPVGGVWDFFFHNAWQELAKCGRLTELRLLCSFNQDQHPDISPEQLLALCQYVPTLKRISHWGCGAIRGLDAEEIEQFFYRNDVHVDVVDIMVSRPFAYEYSDLDLDEDEDEYAGCIRSLKESGLVS